MRKPLKSAISKFLFQYFTFYKKEEKELIRGTETKILPPGAVQHRCQCNLEAHRLLSRPPTVAGLQVA